MGEDLNLLLDQIGMRVVQRRQELGLTQKDLADRLGVTRNSVGNIERGQQNVTLGMLCRFADALEMTLKELMFGAPARR